MKIQEYEAKRIFKENGINIPTGFLVTTPSEARSASEKIKKPVFLKAQVLVAGRGKAGGILKANDPTQAEITAKVLLNTKIKGIPVSSLLVEEKIDIAQELYLGFTIDRSLRRYVMICSAQGGMDLEELARKNPESIVKKYLDPIVGLRSYHAFVAAKNIKLESRVIQEFILIAQKLYHIFIESDAELLESNPLVVTKDGKIVAADARIVIDDNAIYRHTEFKRSSEELTNLEREALGKGLSFVELEGDIGIVGNGAGLVMATLDMVDHYGGHPANFLDVGGGASADQITEAVKLVLKHPKVKVVLLNILGGITKCDEVANGLVNAIKESKRKAPFVVRLAGTNEEEGRKILSRAGIKYLETMEELGAASVAAL